MPRLKCPRCATIVETAPGTSPVCPACGFGGPAPGRAAPPPPPPPAATGGWAATAPAFGAPPPMPMGRPPRPGWVTFVAVLEFIGAGILTVVGLLLIAFGGALATAFEGEYGLSDLAGGFIAAAGGVLIVLGVLDLVVGIFVLKGHQWARVVSLVFAFLGVLGSLGGMARGAFGGNGLGLVLDVLVIVGLFMPQSRAYFGERVAPSHGMAQ